MTIMKSNQAGNNKNTMTTYENTETAVQIYFLNADFLLYIN